MKRLFTCIPLVFILAAAAGYTLFLASSPRAPYPLSFVWYGSQTNAMGATVPVFAVTNNGPCEVVVTPGRQIGSNTFDMLGSLPRKLTPGQDILLPVARSARATNARAFLQCQVNGRSLWPEQVHRYLPRFLLPKNHIQLVFVFGPEEGY